MKTANALKSKQHKIKLSFLLPGQLETDQSLGVTNYNALADVKRHCMVFSVLTSHKAESFSNIEK